MIQLSNLSSNEPMLEMFVFECSQLIEQLEQDILSNEESSGYSSEAINEIFRIMHTIKGSSAMMMFDSISKIAHTMEDVFFFLREQKLNNYNSSTLSDLVLEVIDFIKSELEKIKAGEAPDGDASNLVQNIRDYLVILKGQKPNQNIEIILESTSNLTQEKNNIDSEELSIKVAGNSFEAIVYFESGCEMENIRAYGVVNSLQEIADEISFFPSDIMDNDQSTEVIRAQGFKIEFKTFKSYDEIFEVLSHTIFLKHLVLHQHTNIENIESDKNLLKENEPGQSKLIGTSGNTINESKGKTTNSSSPQSIISVSVDKLDKLMDMVGELVIAEAMVSQNPDLAEMELENFQKAASHLQKICSDLQDMVMSIRMVPLSITFHKMHRIVRDMNKKLDKEVKLELKGEDTEVDKNIIEHISDPLMHLIRNSIDHGIETSDERQAVDKPGTGTVSLEAKSAGGDVLILVKDDGKGLNKDKILKKARENGLLQKAESEMTEKEIYNLIFLPGFSTNEAVSEFSGRGVGMDVVTRNIQNVGGYVSISSIQGSGTTITMKIPLTLAIVEGMIFRIGESRFTIPITSIKESFKPEKSSVITDPDGNEMIMVRGQCYSLLRLHERFKMKKHASEISEGIVIMVENEEKIVCLFADELIGEQQVVVKALPGFIKSIRNIRGISGCTLLGDGSISLILDIAGLV